MERLTNDLPVPTPLQGAVIALGNFDGFHTGHQAVVRKARELAQTEGRPLIVATFDPHPVRFFHPEVPPFRLTSIDQRQRLFGRAGADAMLVFHFDAALSKLTAEQFIVDRLAARTKAALVVTGEDFTFGSDRAGTVATLRTIGEANGIRTVAVAPVSDSGLPVSSSRIRNALKSGDCETAIHLLSHPFAIEGVVEHGAKLGRQLGYPTANLRLGDYLRPAYGIYAVRGRLPNGRVVDGAANLGIRPTIQPPDELLEPYFFDFDGSLYGETIEVELIHRIRSEAKFESLDALKAQMERDCAQARSILAALPRVA